MQNPEILYNGTPITVGYAMSIARKYAERECWDNLELSAIWTRLLDNKEEHEERVICSEMVTSLTGGQLEFLLPEPD